MQTHTAALLGQVCITSISKYQATIMLMLLRELVALTWAPACAEAECKEKPWQWLAIKFQVLSYPYRLKLRGELMHECRISGKH